MSDWSSDVCSYDLETAAEGIVGIAVELAVDDEVLDVLVEESRLYDRVRAEIIFGREIDIPGMIGHQRGVAEFAVALIIIAFLDEEARRDGRSEEHTSELQSLMRISYAVFCLTKKTNIMIQN